MRSDFFAATSLFSRSLMIHNIPHTIEPLFNGYKITFPWCKGDAIIHSYSYGHEEGLFETMGFPWDGEDVTGGLTRRELTNRIVSLFAG